MFDLSITKLLVLAVIAVIVFGPDQLPKLAVQAGRTLRELRRMAEGAKNELREGLGPEFSDLELTDLDPRRFVRKHLFEGLDDLATPPSEQSATTLTSALPAGETPPYDSEAT